MRALFLALVLGVALAEKEEACQCPDFANAIAAGKEIFSSGDTGTVAMQPCCETLAKYKTQLEAGTLTETKNTPGLSCSDLTTCGACTILSFCRWKVTWVDVSQDSPISDTGPCVQVSDIDETAPTSDTDPRPPVYSQKCTGHNVPEFYESAELRFDPQAEPFVQHIHEADKADMTAPQIAFRDQDWPVDYDGYLPPAGCGGPPTKKYPSGLPGCGDYVNEMSSTAEGHLTTDVVSDPRLPVDTHVPAFPLGANPQLPDRVTNNGGNTPIPQPLAAWVHPDFNHNGCLGGPCDPIDQQPCSGLACGGGHRKAGTHHEAGTHHAHTGYVE